MVCFFGTKVITNLFTCTYFPNVPQVSPIGKGLGYTHSSNTISKLMQDRSSLSSSCTRRFILVKIEAGQHVVFILDSGSILPPTGPTFPLSCSCHISPLFLSFSCVRTIEPIVIKVMSLVNNVNLFMPLHFSWAWDRHRQCLPPVPQFISNKFK